MASSDQKMSRMQLTAMVVGGMVGAGIFSLPRTFANATGPLGAVIAWIIAGTGMYMLARGFQALAAEKTRDAALAYPGYASAFLKKVWADAVGFCGSELIRRSVGLSHVADIDTIQDDAMRHECLRHAITLGRALIVLAERIDSVDELLARVRQYS